MSKGVVEICEVGPRDGLQNESHLFTLEQKVDFILALAASGLKSIEVASFVSPKAIPQMADAKELFSQVKEKLKDQKISLPCLVPNERGMQDALEVGVEEIAIFTATSNQFNEKNIKTDIEGSFKRLAPVCEMAKKNKVKIRGYLSTVFGCPYEGKIPFVKALELSKRLMGMGVDEIVLSDTIGMAAPVHVEEVLELCQRALIPFSHLAMHFHDTRGLAVANCFRAYQLGIRKFDSSAAGLGGCPYAQGATGNVATEDLYWLFESQGVSTGINLDLLLKASTPLCSLLNGSHRSKAREAFLRSTVCPTS